MEQNAIGQGERGHGSALVTLKYGNRNVKIQNKSWNMEIFQKKKKGRTWGRNWNVFQDKNCAAG